MSNRVKFFRNKVKDEFGIERQIGKKQLLDVFFQFRYYSIDFL